MSEGLRNALRQKINITKQGRVKTQSLNDTRIYKAVEHMMRDVKMVQIKSKGKASIAQIAELLKPQYEWLAETYFMIFRATCAQEISLPILKMMLLQKERMDREETTIEESSKLVGAVLAKKYNVDIEKLAKGVQEQREAEAAREQQE